jgi:hypothetical protein
MPEENNAMMAAREQFEEQRPLSAYQIACGSCRFWAAMELIDGTWRGECRRCAPMASASQVYFTGIPWAPFKWPGTFEENWCGEYAERSS